jgi:transcriptional regulator with XRE-family HTH domain
MKIVVGQTIKALRIKLDLSQHDMADVFRTSQSTYSRWERESNIPIPKEAMQLLKEKAAENEEWDWTNIEEEYLLKATDTPKRSTDLSGFEQIKAEIKEEIKATYENVIVHYESTIKRLENDIMYLKTENQLLLSKS